MTIANVSPRDGPRPLLGASTQSKAHGAGVDVIDHFSPVESFEALQIDLNDWFAGLGPGSFRLHIAFAKDSGIGEGMTNDIFFTIVDRPDRSR